MSSSDSAILEKIKLAIEEKLDGGAVSSYSIEGRSLSHMNLMDLETLRDKYEHRVNRSKKRSTVNLIRFGSR